MSAWFIAQITIAVIVVTILVVVLIVLSCTSKPPAPTIIRSTDDIEVIKPIAIAPEANTEVRIKQEEKTVSSEIPLGMYNLSVHKTTKGFSGVVRGSTWNGCRTGNIDPPSSHPYSILLDETGKVLKLTPLNVPRFDGCKNRYRGVNANGVEDPRLFIYSGQEWCIANVLGSAQQTHPCVNAMCLFKISNPSESFRVLNLPEDIDPLQTQKNWSPFEYEGRLMCEYSLSPHRILEIDPKTGQTTLVTSGETPDFEVDITLGHSLRGGAPPIRLDDCYLGIGHTRKGSEYYHFFYTFDLRPPFNISGISKIFKMGQPDRIQFAAGLSIYENEVYVSYGINDCYNRISHYPLIEILHMVREPKNSE